MRRHIMRAVVLAICVVSTAAAIAAEEPTKITSIEGITEYRLDNGLKVLLFPDPSTETVTVNLTIFVGSRHEGYGEAGMAHLLEHMLFKGTPTHPNVPKVLKDRGANYNGTTWLDRTNYFETLPAGDENLEFAIRLEADRMVNSNVKAEDLASEMTVVRNEFERGENNPSGILRQRMWAAAFEWHNYGKSTIGNRADIERVPIENLRVFYRQHYQPDNAMLVVAGRFDPAKTLGYVQKYFGKIPSPERKLNTTYTEEPPQDGERLVTLRRVGDVAVVGAAYHIPSGAHPDYPAVDVLADILGNEPAGRLYKALVETKKASDIAAFSYALHDPGLLMILAEVTQGNSPDAVLDTTFTEVEKLVDKGVTEEEVERMKQRLLKQRELAAANSSRIAVQLSEWAAQGDWRLYFLYRDRLEKVTAADVHRVAREYLQKNNRTVGMFLPTEGPEYVNVPETPLLAEMIGDYKGREAIAVGEAFDPSPQNVEQRSKRVMLPSGLKAVLLPKKTRGETVRLQLTLRYGNEDDLQGLSTAVEALPTLMLRGTKKLSRQQLQDALDKNLAQLSGSKPQSDFAAAAFTLQTKREKLPAVLELLRQVLREPALSDEELELIRQARISRYEQALTDPQMLATTAVRRKLYPYPKGDPRSVPTIDEEIELWKSLETSDVRKLYDEFLSGQHGELVIIGDFDVDETVKKLSSMLGDWKAKTPYSPVPVTGDVKLTAETNDILTPGKANATYFAATVFPMNDAHPDYAALTIGNFIFGGGSLSSRLGDRVRQKEGLSYGVGSGFSARSTDDRAALYMYAICNPTNMPQVKKVIREELDKLLKDGVTEQELAAAKKGYLEQQKNSRANDSQLLSTLSETAQVDRTMDYYVDLETKIGKLSRDDVSKALRKYLDPKRFVVVAAGDFGEKTAGK